MTIPLKIVVILAFMAIGFVLGKIAFDYIFLPLNIWSSPLLAIGVYTGFIFAFAFIGFTITRLEED